MMQLSPSSVSLFAEGPDISPEITRQASRREFWSRSGAANPSAVVSGEAITAGLAATGAGLVPTALLNVNAKTFMPNGSSANSATDSESRGSKRSAGKPGRAGRKDKSRRSSPGESKAPEEGFAKGASKNAQRKGGKSRKRNQKSKGNSAKMCWWKTLEETIVDPISLEPIKDLNYPPFELVSQHKTSDPSKSDGRVTHYFDGQFLAHYVVSTANFINPVNRARLDLGVCKRLDAYLRENTLPSARVAECFRLFEASSAKQVGEESAHARQLRQEATAVMAALFRTRSNNLQDQGDGGGSNRARSKKKRNTSSNDRRGPEVETNYSYERKTEGHGGGLVIVDEDNWERPEAFNLSEERDFPSFAGPNADASAAAAAAPQHLHPSERSALRQAQKASGEEGSKPAPSNEPQWRVVAGAGSLPYMNSAAEFPSLPPNRRKISKLVKMNNVEGKNMAKSRWDRLREDRVENELQTASEGAMKLSGKSTASKSLRQGLSMAVDESAPSRPARLALRLKKRSVDSAKDQPVKHGINPVPLEEQEKSGAASVPESYSSIFGEARPVDAVQVSKMNRFESDDRPGIEDFGSPTQAMRLAEEHSNRPICPYSPWLLGFGLHYGSRWILSIERIVQEDIERRNSRTSGSLIRTDATCSLPPMPKGQRKFVHEYLQKHWGLRTISVDPAPNRFVQVHYKLSYPIKPLVLLSKAMYMYHDLAVPASMLATVRDPPRTSSYAAQLGFWNISAPGGLRIAKSQIGALLGQTSARRSEYHLAWVDSHNLLVQFESAAVGRKAFRQLDALQGRSGTITWHQPIQWFPEPPEWAAQQIHLRANAKKDAQRYAKEESQRRALREQERVAALKFREDSQRHSGRDAWDVSDGDDNASDDGFASATASNLLDHEVDAIQRQQDLLAREHERKIRRRQAKQVERTKSTEVKSLVALAREGDQNIWSNLSSSEDDTDTSESDYSRSASGVAFSATPMLSADNRVASAVPRQTVCVLCDDDLALKAGLDPSSSIDDCINAGQAVPRCRQCKNVICSECASSWQKSTCPFCRCNNYLNEFIFQQKQLKEAGFKDSVSNIAALQSTNGDVNAAIALLVREN